MWNSLEVPRNWNYASLRRAWSMNLCTREKRDEWKGKRKMSFFLPVFCPFQAYAASTNRENQWVFFLSVPHFGSIWIFFHFSFYQVFYYSLTLWYLFLVCHLIFSFNDPNNYDESYRISTKNLLYSNCTLVVFLHLSAVLLKSQMYLGEQGRIHQSKQRQVWVLVSHADYSSCPKLEV